MAQLLTAFEEDVEPLVSKEVAEKFKVLVRRKMNALAVDTVDLMNLESKAEVRNGAAQDLRDRTFVDGIAQGGS